MRAGARARFGRLRQTLLVTTALIGCSALPAAAQDATWASNPGSNVYGTASNWTPAAVPTGTASFGASNVNTILLLTDVTIGGWTFNAGAPAYTFRVGGNLDFTGAGIVDNGRGVVINDGGGSIQFHGTSTAGDAAINIKFLFAEGVKFVDASTAGNATITNDGALTFLNTSTASNATITNNFLLTFGDAATAGHSTITNGASLVFVDNSTAGNATITNIGGGLLFRASSSAGSATIKNDSSLAFSDTSTAGRADITNSNALTFSNQSTAGGAVITNTGGVQFFDSSNAGTATIINKHQPVPGDPLGEAAIIEFDNSSSAGNATITNTGGVTFLGRSTAGNAAISNGASGSVDFSLSSGANGDGKLSAGSIAGGGTFRLGSNQLTVGGNNSSTDVTGIIMGLGSLVKIGTGTMTLSGDNGYTGATTVNAGALVVDGSILSATTVNGGGALGGGGSIQNDVTINSGGMLAPGSAANPTGTLTITGNLAFQSAAIYLVNLNGAATSNTMVSGSASLSGASVEVASGVALTKGAQYTILHADGGVNGTFNPQVRFGALVGAFTYDTNDVFLAFSQSALGSASGLNLNQQRVANAIDGFFNGGGALPAAFVNLLGQSGAPMANALTQLSGETATGSQQTTFNAMNQFMGVMTDPFMNRTGSPGTSQHASGYAEEALGYASSKKTDAFAGFTKAPQASSFEQRWSVWAAGFGGSQNTSGNTSLGSNNTTSNIGATAVGADYLISPNTLAGFALAGGGTSFSVANGGSGRSDLFQLGAYVRHNQGPAYISAALAYGWQDITTNRTVTAAGRDQLRAEFNANAWSGRLEGGYRVVSPATSGVGFTPYAAAQFVTFDLPAYAEQAISGASQFALTYNAKDVTDVRSELGFRTDKSFVMPNGVLTLRGRVAWAHDFDPDRSIAATFQALPGASFVVNGAAQAADSALTTASIEMTWKNGWSAAATFEGEFSNVTSSYAGKGVVRYQW